jgi:RND family efflux transporter MFP subunit
MIKVIMNYPHKIYLIPSLFIITLLLAACSTEENSTAAKSASSNAKQVETAIVKSLDYQTKVIATGRLALEEEAKLSFKTGGIIARINVSEGQKVRKGTVLATLDLQEIQARNQQAQLGKQQAAIGVDNARLALRLAQRDYDNAKGLYQDSVATLEQLENAEVQLDNARNQLAQAEKSLDMQGQQVSVADFNLQYSRIVAPSDGVILKKMAEVNELAGAGTPIFRFGSSEKAKVIRTSLTDKDIIHVQLGNKANIRFDAYPNSIFTGVVTEIASLADAYTGTYEVEIQLNDEKQQLLSGFIGQVEIITNTTAGLLQIPIDALLGANGDKGEVFVVENGKAVKTDIQIFKIQHDQLLIKRGLDSSDQVITSGVGYIEDAEEVLISER